MCRTILRSGVTAILSLTLLTVSVAQTPPRKKKPIKDFGSSLKRLKWDPEKNATAEIAPPGNKGSELSEGDVIRTDTSLVTAELLVLDERGSNVTGLTADDFVIAENGESQKVGHFVKGDSIDVPRSIVLIIDYSGSQSAFIKNSIAAAKVLVDKLGPKDLMAIVTDDVELLLDFTNDKDQLKAKLDSLLADAKPDPTFFAGKRRLGKSMQYSALLATLSEAFDAEDVRPIIIFQTDGDEAFWLRNSTVEPSIPPELTDQELMNAKNITQQRQKERQEKLREFSLDDLYLAVERSRSTVYTVIPGYKQLGLTADEQVAKLRAVNQKRNAQIMATMSPASQQRFKKWLEIRESNTSVAGEKYRAEHTFNLQLALAAVGPLTGGWTEFLENPEQADGIYARIFSDINQRYIVGYYPTNKARDGKRRKIEFQVKGHPEYQILGRRSYFAPK